MIDYSSFSEEALLARLVDLRQDHADLDAAIQSLSLSPLPDMMLIGRLKRKKLGLKDEITKLRGRVIPDISA